MNVYVCLLTEAFSYWHRHIVWSFQEMGHQVFMPSQIGLDDSWHRMENNGWSFRHRARLSERLLEDVQRVHQEKGLDLFFIYLFPFQFDPPIFKQIEKLGVPTVLFYCDNLNNDKVAEEFAPFFTLNWVPELEATALYQKLKRRFIYLPMAANPTVYKPLGLKETKEATFVGSKNSYRRWLLGSLIKRGIPLEIYGNFWSGEDTFYELDSGKLPLRNLPRLSPVEKTANFLVTKRESARLLVRYGLRRRKMRALEKELGEEFEPLFQNQAWGHPVEQQRMVELFSESKVSIGINQYTDPSGADLFKTVYSRMRDFEAPMSGACYLTQYTRELDHFYPEEGAVMTYRSPDELYEKAAWLLQQDEARRAMRQKARSYALEHHTWQHRFKKMFEVLGLRGSSP